MRTTTSQVQHGRTPNSMMKEDCAQMGLSAEHNIEALPARITWIANFIPPYAAWMYQNLGERLQDFRLLLSTGMEKGRTWAPDLSLPNTRIQRTLSWTYQSRHPNGFTETLQSHFPYDTIPLLLKEKPKVVISSELGARTVQALIYRLLCPATRLIVRATVSEVSEQGRGGVRRRLRRVMLNHADAILVNGQSGARYIRRFGVPLEKLFTVPYTTDTTALTRLPLEKPPEAALRLLFVGQLIGRKGLFPFLEILREWALRHETRTVNLWVVGTGCLGDSLERYAFSSNVTVRFLGAVPYGNLPNVYAECGLLVFPTLSDEWGMVVNEAMAAGLPVLGSLYSQAVEELVRDAQNGWCFRPDSKNEMYSALDRALNTSESKMSEMRRDARKTVAYLTPSYAAERVLDAVRFVSSQRGANERLGSSLNENREFRRCLPASRAMNCLFCGHSAVMRFQRNDSFMWECTGEDCGLEFLHPQPTDEQLSTAYASLYYPDRGPQRRVPFENTPVEVLEQALDCLTIRLGNLNGLELLDYGCGQGRLCALAARRGMTVTGIEPSNTARMQARGSGIVVFGSLEELIRSVPETSFDLITLWDVIEHLREPWYDLRSLQRVLKPGGRLLVSTMNTRSLRARIQGPRWENYSNPTHTFFFNRHSLGSMIARTGFVGTEEWILPIRYPQHGFLRRSVHRFLMATSLNAEIVFVGTNDRTPDENPSSDSFPVAANFNSNYRI